MKTTTNHGSTVEIEDPTFTDEQIDNLLLGCSLVTKDPDGEDYWPESNKTIQRLKEGLAPIDNSPPTTKERDCWYQADKELKASLNVEDRLRFALNGSDSMARLLAEKLNEAKSVSKQLEDEIAKLKDNVSWRNYVLRALQKALGKWRGKACSSGRKLESIEARTQAQERASRLNADLLACKQERWWEDRFEELRWVKDDYKSIRKFWEKASKTYPQSENFYEQNADVLPPGQGRRLGLMLWGSCRSAATSC